MASAMALQRCGCDVRYYISRRGLGQRVVEHYTRTDLACHSGVCGRESCNSFQALGSIPSAVQSDEPPQRVVFLFPSRDLVVDYFEVVEQMLDVQRQSKSTDVMDALREGFRLTRDKICTMAKDARIPLVLFDNEHLAECFLYPSATKLQQRMQQRVMEAASWYSRHLSAQPCARVVALVEQTQTADVADSMSSLSINAQAHSGVAVQTLKEQLERYFGEYPQLLTLFESVCSAALLRRLQKERVSVGSRRNNSLFDAHWSASAVEDGLASGTLFRGSLQITRSSSEEAFVRLSDEDADGLGGDVFVPSRLLRNRGIHNDVVAVQLLPESEWTCPSSRVVGSEDDADVPSMSSRRLPTGRVVAIIERRWRLYVCTLQLDASSSARHALFVPMESRIPKIRVQTRQAERLQDVRVTVRIDDWDMDSKYPNGHYVRELGPIGAVDTETAAILVEHEISNTEFTPRSMNHLPATEDDFHISKDELSRRRDLRELLVMSIDPPGCTDVDDALSVRRLSTTKIEIGIHIADVSYFVPHNSLLDIEARDRGTTVYLADRRIDMLPSILSEHLCSLREGKDRYAVSVVITVDTATDLVTDVWYGRTVIRSRHAFSYEEAQHIVNGSMARVERARMKDYDECREAILMLLKFARVVEARRMQRGALELQSLEVRVELTENAKPCAIHAKEEREVNKMIAEYMILANEYVAEKIYRSFPTCALLRRHPPPRPTDFEALISAAAVAGFEMDVLSSKTLAASLNHAGAHSNATVNFLLRELATKAMAEAKYFSTGECEEDDFRHYGLAADFYTHFTSPIRRYADLVVHRQLLAAIAPAPAAPPSLRAIPPLKGSLNGPLAEAVQDVCNHLNKKNREAKLASSDSAAFFQTLYFKELLQQNNGALLVDGMVHGLRRNGLYVIIPKFGLKGMAFLQDKEKNSLIPPDALQAFGVELTGQFDFDADANAILLHTTKGDTHVIRGFERITVELLLEESRARFPSPRLRLRRFLREGVSTGAQSSQHAVFSKMKVSEMVRATVKERSDKGARSRLEDMLSAHDIERFHQTAEEESLYELFDKFRVVRVTPNEALPSS